MLFLFPGRCHFCCSTITMDYPLHLFNWNENNAENRWGKTNSTHHITTQHTDNNINWFVENSPSVAIGSSRTENRSLFRIWCSCVNFIDGNIRIDRPLASVHMVCNTPHLSNTKSTTTNKYFPRNIFIPLHAILTGTVQFISDEELINDISIQF